MCGSPVLQHIWPPTSTLASIISQSTPPIHIVFKQCNGRRLRPRSCRLICFSTVNYMCAWHLCVYVCVREREKGK